MEDENITRNYMIYQIRKTSEKIGKTPTSRDMLKIFRHNDVVKYFGTFNNLVKEAGLPINKKGTLK